MKMLLIFPPRRADSYMFPPCGLLYIAQALRAAGHEAEIVDIPYLMEKFPEKYSLFDNSLFDYIFNKEFDVLGLGGVVSTYFFYDYFVKKFREEKKGIPIVVGCSVGLPIKEVWEKYNPVDYLVEGDGEQVACQLLDCLEKKDYPAIEKIPGLYYLKNGKYQGNPPKPLKDIDQIPFLNYDELDYEYYIDELTRYTEDVLPDRSLLKQEKLRFLPLMTSRGCVFNCTFCFHFNRNYRKHSVEYVVEYLKFLKKKYRINGLMVIDDLFNCSPQHTIELCDSIHKADLGLYFFAGGGKPSLITGDALVSMKKAGFIRLSYGIETGSQKILDQMQKQTTVEDNLRALSLAEEKGVPCFANMVFGMPGEDAQTLQDTKNFLIKAGLSTKRFYGSWATAYPGTQLFDWMKEKGIVTDTRKYLFEVGSFGNMLYNLTDVPTLELKKLASAVFWDVDMAYHLKHREYLIYARKTLIFWLRKIMYIFPERAQKKLRVMGKILLPKEKQMKRTVKRSDLEIEKWISLITNE